MVNIWIKGSENGKDCRYYIDSSGRLVKTEYTGSTQTDQSWKKAYLEALKQFARESKMSVDKMDACLVYIDEDNIPEMFASTCVTAYGGKVFSYRNGKVTSQIVSAYQVIYAEKTGHFCDQTGRMGYYPTFLYTLKNGVYTLAGEGVYRQDYAYPDGPFQYEWEHQPVSEQEYWNHVNPHIPKDKSITVGLEQLIPYKEFVSNQLGL